MMTVGTTTETWGTTDLVLDSGASHHVTGDAAVLTGVVGCPPVDIRLADGRVLRATRSGMANISVAVPHVLHPLRLINVLSVPG